MAMLSYHAVQRADRKKIHASKVGEKKSLKFGLQCYRKWHHMPTLWRNLVLPLSLNKFFF